MKLTTAVELFFHNREDFNKGIADHFCRTRFSRILPDKFYLKLMYWLLMGKRLNLKEPTTFNEKLQWIKLYDRNELYPVLADKLQVKEYVADKIGKQYVINTLSVWDSVEKLDLEKLPEKFVIKCSHDSGSVIACNHKKDFPMDLYIRRMNYCFHRNLFWLGREWPYKNLVPHIFAEEYLIDDKTNELRDYKLFCFNGKAKIFKIDFDRFIQHRANYYDLEGNILPFGEKVCPPDYDRQIPMPVNLDEMIRLAEELAKGIPFVRVDFYEANNRIYFGEMTFFPAMGFGHFTGEEWDETLGSWIELKSCGGVEK